MTEQEAQDYAINTYNANIQYIEKAHPELFQNLSLFNTALDLEELKPQFDLNFTNGYFDIKNLSTNQLLYGSNSFEISKSLIQNLNTNPLDKSFKAFYPQYPNDEEAKIALEKGLLSEYTFGNAPIVNFVNNNLAPNQELKEIHKFIIFGVGLGIHIPLIHEKLKSSLYLIIEPNLEIFRLSLFVTNYAKLAKEANLILAVAQNEENFRKAFDTFYNDSFIFNHYFKFFQLNDNFSLYTRTIQNRLVSQEFYLYPYNRTFLSIFRTNSYIMEKYKILNLSKNHNLDFTKKPILYLAAGPSLQKNIEFVKKNQEKFIIVAIYATLPFLEQNEIKPDIITQYDEQDVAVLNTLEKVKNIDFFDNTIFIFSSHVNAKLINSFKKENIYIFQAMFEQKNSFGVLTSPSIGELTYGLLLKLGAKEIYLLGLDLALESESGKSHIDGHSGANAYANLKDESESTDNQYSYKKNIIRVKGNFQDTVKTTPSFKTNIDCFEFFTREDKSKDTKVYNLSDGAYLSDTIPLDVEKSTLDNFKEKQKNLKELIKENLEKISEIDYSKEDIETINFKISNAKKMKKALDTFFKIKNYNKLKDYENNLIYTLQVLIFENNSLDLKSILTNYCQHNIPFIFHLFNTNKEDKNLSFISKINKILYIQLNKVIDTYLVSILYSRNEKNQLNKKLNKLVKEYKLDKTIFCDPQFKELVETTQWGEIKTFGENSIGLFAINENLDNKNFISYIENIVKTYKCKLQIMYIFEQQKNKAFQIFKNIKNNLEFTLPNKIEDIANKIEVYLDASNHNCLEKINDILLNNYTNILCISFDEKKYLENKTLIEIEEENTSLKDKLISNILPNTKYYSFAQSLNNINEEKLLELHKKETLGFFGFEENLTKEFVENIYELAKKFPNLKFSCFYFTEKQKKKFEKVFALLLNRFNFIIPNNIYDIANEIEVWTQASIENQSFIYTKIYELIDNSTNIFNVILDDKFKIKTDIDSSKYLEYIIKNYNENRFIKKLMNQDNHEFNSTYCQNTIGFLAINDNLNDVEFIEYLNEIMNTYDNYEYTLFYFKKEIALSFFNKFNRKNINLIELKELKDLYSNIEIFICNLHKNKYETKLISLIANSSHEILPIGVNIGNKLTIKKQSEILETYYIDFFENIEYFNFKKTDLDKYKNGFYELFYLASSKKYGVEINFNLDDKIQESFKYILEIGYKNHQFIRDFINLRIKLKELKRK